MYFSMDSPKTIELVSLVDKAMTVFTSSGNRDGDERAYWEANQAIPAAEEEKWIWYKRIQMIITRFVPVFQYGFTKDDWNTVYSEKSHYCLHIFW